MKATISFNLDNPDDLKAHHRVMKATHMAIILWEIQNNLVKKLESKVELWGNKCTSEYLIDTVKTEINTLFDEYNLTLDDIID
jgi:hypothetical protein